MIAVRGYEGQRVGVLGLGRSGLATARALAAGGAEPLCWDDGEAPRARAEAEGHLIADLSRPREAASLALLVVSPGIPHLFPEPHPAVARALETGTPLDNDVGLFFRALLAIAAEEEPDGPPPRIVAVTGSNGKSTTTALIAHLLTSAKRAARTGGNIGRALLDLDPPEAGETLVIELSSYQIELARALAPDLAVFLNLTPDHLDRHGGFGGYFAAKRRLFEQGAPERAVIGTDDVYGRFLAAAAGPDAIRVTLAKPPEDGWSVSVRKGFLAERRDGRQLAAIDLRAASGLQGTHNHQNAAAAYAAVRALGLGPRQIEPGLAAFRGLAHRAERIATLAGVLYVNDSKATNAEAAEKALATYERIRWLAGGRAKEGGIAALAPVLPRVEKAYFFGEAAPLFARQLAEMAGPPAEIHADMAAAFAAAHAEAAEGETVLLSPAAASFDQFPDFEARGEAFRALVAEKETER
ncbi:MAG: UDP-N-acetylmuramoyl-L-alanine--D-glutamate ligase [Paracoccaceae bacterium]